MNDFEEMIDEELEEDREEQYFYLVDFLRERVTGKETLSELIDIFESMCQLPIEGIDQEEDCVLFQCGTYRFLGETLVSAGKLQYDRWWWTVRQAGFQLFRVGELEYEIVREEDETYIDMHIPSDADFSPARVDESLALAAAFLRAHFPDVAACQLYCHSWLLARELRDMLPESSNILSFQRRFEILSEDEGERSCHWVFQTKNEDIPSLPENTSLQRKMKAHFLAGGLIHGARGRLRTIPDEG